MATRAPGILRKMGRNYIGDPG